MSQRTAYEDTDVPVARSQEQIRRLVLENGGTGIAFICQPPIEGFEALLTVDGKTYRIRIVATCRQHKSPDRVAQEERRVWRVLFFHLKAVFEASRSGVLELREMILPYIVVADGRTIAQHILPNVEKALIGKPNLMLPPARPEEK